MSQYRFTRTAQKDLKAIKDYTASQNLQAACQFADEVVQKCQTLAQFPEMGRLPVLPSSPPGLPL